MAIILTNSAGKCGMQQAILAYQETFNAIDTIEKGIREVEKHPSIHTVGYGGWPNLLGEVELDASIMDGDTCMAGAVGALKGYLHPLSVARKIMEKLPNILLVGDGAARFAEECGAEKAELLNTWTKARWKAKIFDKLSAEQQNIWPQLPLSELSNKAIDPDLERGTTCFLVLDNNFRSAVGVSTSGLAWKYPGRLGDSPLIGAGAYADSRYGSAACIGTGEMAIRACSAKSIVLYLKMGMGSKEACYEAFNDLKYLRGGLRGDITLFALERNGAHHVLCIGESAVREYCIWTDRLPSPETLEAEKVLL